MEEEQADHVAADDEQGSGAGSSGGYEELDGVECVELDDEEGLLKIERGDPSVEGLLIYDADDESDHPDVDLERLGRSIGDSTRLRILHVDDIQPPSKAPSSRPLWEGIARNGSIEHISFTACDFYGTEDAVFSEVFSYLLPLFERNRNVRCVRFHGCNFQFGSHHAVSALSKCTKLMRLDVLPHSDRWGHLGRLIDSLHVHPHLFKVALKLGSIAECQAFAKLIQNPASRIKILNLLVSAEDEGCLDIFSRALIANDSINDLRLILHGPISPADYRSLSSALSDPHCALEKLDLHHTRQRRWLSARGLLAAMGTALVANRSVKHLDLNYTESEIQGWHALSACLANPNSMLEVLLLSASSIDDAGAASILGALPGNKALKKLCLDHSKFVSASGWRDGFASMRRSRSNLEEVSLVNNKIDDAGAALLVEALVGGTVRDLNIGRNVSISSAGWQSLTDLVRQPGCTLEELCIGGISDDIMVAFAGALANNTSLKKLACDGDGTITSRGWDALSCLLCDTTSITSTFDSNHSLREICLSTSFAGIPVGGGVLPLLRMNESDEKWLAVARQKILVHHFPEGSGNICHFADMEMNCMPHAIEWIGRDALGFTLMYHLMHAMPSLFEMDTKIAGKKRKLH